MADDGEPESYRFGLVLEVDDSTHTLDISFTGIPRWHVPYMFAPAISDVITTTLMDMAMIDYDEDDDEEEEE